MIFEEISNVMKSMCRDRLKGDVCKMFGISPSTMSGILKGDKFLINYNMVRKLFEFGYDIKLVKRNIRKNPITLDEKVAAARAQGKSYGEWQAEQYAAQMERKRRKKSTKTMNN